MNLPPDPEGMNGNRAMWADVALVAYSEETGTFGNEDDGTILGDLLCDLRHYCDRHGINFDAVFERSTKCYHEEIAG